MENGKVGKIKVSLLIVIFVRFSLDGDTRYIQRAQEHSALKLENLLQLQMLFTSDCN